LFQRVRNPVMTSLVSIIVPCYNAAPWLAQTLESALAQTWPRCEIIVVDDGSRDESLAIARTFEPRGVRVFAQPNAGASAARNRGLREARGDFIQFLDADDLLAPDKIAAQLALLDQAGPRMLASGAWGRFRHDPSEADFSPHPTWRDLSGVEFQQLNFEAMDMMHPAAWLCPRALLDLAGPWDESLTLNDDGEFFARVTLASGGIRFCGAARSYYRSQLADSLSRRSDARSMDSLFRSVKLTIGHLLSRDRSPRTIAAAAFAWKWTAFELYPAAPVLAQRAEAESHALGGSPRPFPGGPRFQITARILGWRLARRLMLASKRV
jgi:glycosyltransferase involved in cell wall biosynthesis